LALIWKIKVVIISIVFAVAVAANYVAPIVAAANYVAPIVPIAAN
jgi:hypothetical protein